MCARGQVPNGWPVIHEVRDHVLGILKHVPLGPGRPLRSLGHGAGQVTHGHPVLVLLELLLVVLIAGVLNGSPNSQAHPQGAWRGNRQHQVEHTHFGLHVAREQQLPRMNVGH